MHALLLRRGAPLLAKHMVQHGLWSTNPATQCDSMAKQLTRKKEQTMVCAVFWQTQPGDRVGNTVTSGAFRRMQQISCDAWAHRSVQPMISKTKSWLPFRK